MKFPRSKMLGICLSFFIFFVVSDAYGLSLTNFQVKFRDGGVEKDDDNDGKITVSMRNFPGDEVRIETFVFTLKEMDGFSGIGGAGTLKALVDDPMQVGFDVTGTLKDFGSYNKGKTSLNAKTNSPNFLSQIEWRGITDDNEIGRIVFINGLPLPTPQPPPPKTKVFNVTKTKNVSGQGPDVSLLGVFDLDFASGSQNSTLTIEDQFVGVVHEPSTFLLFGSGLAGLGVWRWRKARGSKS